MTEDISKLINLKTPNDEEEEFPQANLFISHECEYNSEPYKRFELLNSSVASFMISPCQIKNSSNKKQKQEEDENQTITEEDMSLEKIELIQEKNNFIKSEENLNNSSEINSIIIKDKSNNFNQGRWSPQEHQMFIQAMYLYGNEWKRVQEYIHTRSSTQARSHAQKFFIRLKKKISDENLYDEETIQNKTEKIMFWINESIPHHILKDQIYNDEHSTKLCKVIFNLMTGHNENPSKKRNRKKKNTFANDNSFNLDNEQKDLNSNQNELSQDEFTTNQNFSFNPEQTFNHENFYGSLFSETAKKSLFKNTFTQSSFKLNNINFEKNFEKNYARNKLKTINKNYSLNSKNINNVKNVNNLPNLNNKNYYFNRNCEENISSINSGTINNLGSGSKKIKIPIDENLHIFNKNKNQNEIKINNNLNLVNFLHKKRKLTKSNSFLYKLTNNYKKKLIFNIVKDCKKKENVKNQKIIKNSSIISQVSSNSYQFKNDDDIYDNINKIEKMYPFSQMNMIKNDLNQASVIQSNQNINKDKNNSNSHINNNYIPSKHKHYINIVNINIDNNKGSNNSFQNTEKNSNKNKNSAKQEVILEKTNNQIFNQFNNLTNFNYVNNINNNTTVNNSTNSNINTNSDIITKNLLQHFLNQLDKSNINFNDKEVIKSNFQKRLLYHFLSSKSNLNGSELSKNNFNIKEKFNNVNNFNVNKNNKPNLLNNKKNVNIPNLNNPIDSIKPPNCKQPISHLNSTKTLTTVIPPFKTISNPLLNSASSSVKSYLDIDTNLKIENNLFDTNFSNFDDDKDILKFYQREEVPLNTNKEYLPFSDFNFITPSCNLNLNQNPNDNLNFIIENKASIYTSNEDISPKTKMDFDLDQYFKSE